MSLFSHHLQKGKFGEGMGKKASNLMPQLCKDSLILLVCVFGLRVCGSFKCHDWECVVKAYRILPLF